jgi:hypothetical protein
MSHDHGERDEKQNEGNQPEDDVGGSSLGGGAEEIQNNDEEDLRHHQVEEAKLFAQSGAVGLDCSLGGSR